MTDLVNKIIMAESGGNRFAKNPRSSAAGPAQFIDSTWLATVRKHRPDLAGRTNSDLLRLKFDADLSKQMASAYASDNQGFLKSKGIDPNPGNTYLAHFAGPQGAAAIHANPNAPIERILTPGAIAANPFLRGKTGADVINWAAGKVGAKAPASTYQAQSAISRATGGSDMAAPIGGAPIAGGPVPLVPPTGRKSKLGEALLASAAAAKPKGWGELLNAAGDLALGYTLTDKHDKEQTDYRSKLSQALSGASGTDGLAQTLIASGDPDMMTQGVKLKVADAKPKSQVGRFQATKQGIFDSMTGQIVPGTEQKATGDGAEYGTTPVPYIGADGKTYYTQISKAGGRKDIDLPEGAKWASGVDKVDVGTGTVLIDKKTGAQRETIDSNLAEAEARKVVGKQAGEAQANLPAAKTTVENAFKTIAELEKHPGLEAGTGLSNVADPRSWMPGTDAYNFLAKNKQAQAQSFMGAREALKGAGQVTDFEGERGQTAIAALDAAQSRDQYLAALKDLKRMMQASYDDMQKKAGLGAPAQNPDMPKPVKTMRYNPQTGEIE